MQIIKAAGDNNVVDFIEHKKSTTKKVDKNEVLRLTNNGLDIFTTFFNYLGIASYDRSGIQSDTSF